MVGPSGGIGVTHSEYVSHHGEHCQVLVTPDVVEEAKSADMQNTLCWKFTQKEVKSRYRRGFTHDIVVEYSQRF